MKWFGTILGGLAGLGALVVPVAMAARKPKFNRIYGFVTISGNCPVSVAPHLGLVAVRSGSDTSSGVPMWQVQGTGAAYSIEQLPVYDTPVDYDLYLTIDGEVADVDALMATVRVAAGRAAVRADLSLTNC